jgi:prepilin-type N-terminal cleavage/methylation domain-containing protein
MIRTAAQRRASRSGFSLIEIVAVLAVLGMIAGLVTINWRAMLPKAELHSAVRAISQDINGTRSEAIARNAEFLIEYDLEKSRWRMVSPFRLGGGGLAQTDEERMRLSWKELPASIRFLRVVIDGVDYTQGICAVRFDPLGGSSGHCIVLGQSPDNHIFSIEVQGLTGTIHLHDGTFVREPAKDGDFQ